MREFINDNLLSNRNLFDFDFYKIDSIVFLFRNKTDSTVEELKENKDFELKENQDE
jgi:hypothetical protein